MAKNSEKAWRDDSDAHRLPGERHTGAEALLDGEVISLDEHRSERAASHTMQSRVPPLCFDDDSAGRDRDGAPRDSRDGQPGHRAATSSDNAYTLLAALATTEKRRVFTLSSDAWSARFLVENGQIIALTHDLPEDLLADSDEGSSRAHTRSVARILLHAHDAGFSFTNLPEDQVDAPALEGKHKRVDAIELLLALNALRSPELAELAQQVGEWADTEHSAFWVIERGRTAGIERVLAVGQQSFQSLELLQHVVALAEDLSRKTAAMSDAFSPGTSLLYAFSGEKVWLNAATGRYIVIGRGPSRRLGVLGAVMTRIADALTHIA